MTLRAESVHDAVAGGLLGVAAGDALGATLEFMSPVEVRHTHGVHRDIVGGGMLGWRPGQGTDDTDLTWAVLDGYLLDHDHDTIDSIAEQFLAWFATDPQDVGDTTRRALTDLRDTRDPASSGLSNERSCGNGSLMRALPTALLRPDAELRRAESARISAITHAHARCIDSCVAYNEVAATLLEGAEPAEAIAVAGSLELHPAVQAALAVAPSTRVDELQTSGFVIDSLRCAVWAIQQPDSFENVLVALVNRGDDSDTTGAIAGGLLGVMHGAGAIPLRWLDRLEYGHAMIRASTRVVERRGRADASLGAAIASATAAVGKAITQSGRALRGASTAAVDAVATGGEMSARVLRGAGTATVDAVATGGETVTEGARVLRDASAAAFDAASDGAAVVGAAVSDAARAASGGARSAADAVKRHSVQTAGLVQAVLVGDIAKQFNGLVGAAVAGPASVYDKAMDANYLDPLLRPELGGSYHRLFDGGHTVAGAVQAVRAASTGDGFAEQTVGTMEALLRDASTPRGLPLATWDKATFDSVAQHLEAGLGIPKNWLYEISTYDTADMLGAAVGVVAVALNWRRADTEEFARLTAGMGLSAAASLNPLLLLVVLVSAAQAFCKAKSRGEYAELADGAFRGAATSAASIGAITLVTAAGGTAGAGLLLGVAAGVLAHAATQRVSVTQIASVVSQRAGALAETAIGWATEVLSREDHSDSAEAADVMVAREILALPMMSSATEASAPILDALSEP